MTTPTPPTDPIPAGAGAGDLDPLYELALGDGLRATVLTSGDETSGRHDVTDCEQPPGAETPLHLHTRYDERFWVVSGTMTAFVGTDVVDLGPGSFLTVPAGTPHMLRAGPRGVRTLVISSPAAFAELLARTATPVAGPPDDGAPDVGGEQFMAVTTELGDVVLGPPGTTPADLTHGG